MCISVAATYSQDCNSYLRRATELQSQKKYCEAKSYYQKYSNCDADADVSTEIAMCERFCTTQAKESVEDKSVDTPDRDYDLPPKDKQSDSRTVKPVSTVSKQGFRGFQLHGGVFLPLGEGNIATGYNLGFKVYIPVSSVRGLSCFLGADALYNGLKSKFKDALIKDIEEEVEYIGESKYKYTLPFCLNVPVTAGINYAYAINNKFSIYGEVVGGCNFSQQMGLSFSIPEVDYSYKEKYDMAAGFTYGLEAGVLLNKKITLGIRYNDFGSYKYKGKIVEDGDEEDFKSSSKVALNGISFSLGILF